MEWNDKNQKLSNELEHRALIYRMTYDTDIDRLQGTLFNKSGAHSGLPQLKFTGN